MNELMRKRISRSALLRHSKKLETQIDEVISDYERGKLAELKGLQLNFKTQLEKIDNVDLEIFNQITDETELETEMLSALETEDKFYDVISNIDQCLIRINQI